MSDAAASAAVPIGAYQAPTEAQKRAQIKQTAGQFETSFLSVMMQSMFQGVDQDDPFGGGEGEQQFRSFFTDAIAKQVSKAGGIGLSSSIEREMLKMQGLS